MSHTSLNPRALAERIVKDEDLLDRAIAILADSTPSQSKADLAESLAALAAEWLLEQQAILHAERTFTAAHLRIVYLLAETSAATDTQLVRRWASHIAPRAGLGWPPISESGLRSRRAELHEWGLVEWSGAWGQTRNGRPSRIWQNVSLERELLAGQGLAPVPGFEPTALTALAALLEEAGADVVIAAALRHAQRAAGHQ
jgi:hypothetical protein